MRETVALECTECKRRTYTVSKNRGVQKGRLEQKKFCPHCNRRTVHKETK